MGKLMLKLNGPQNFSHCVNMCIFLQNLEDSMMKNVLRSVHGDTHFQGRELQDLFVVFKVIQ